MIANKQPAVIEVRVMPIESLKPAPYNPRKVLKESDPAYQKLKASISEFGLVEPLIWNELTGRVVGGHTRLRILKSLGFQEVPVSVVRLSEAREKALNIVLNNHEAQGRYDTEKLAALLTELEPLPESELTGFTKSDLRALRFKPAEQQAVEKLKGKTIVTLEMNSPVFDKLATKLDALIGEYDLISHVQRA